MFRPKSTKCGVPSFTCRPSFPDSGKSGFSGDRGLGIQVFP